MHYILNKIVRLYTFIINHNTCFHSNKKFLNIVSFCERNQWLSCGCHSLITGYVHNKIINSRCFMTKCKVRLLLYQDIFFLIIGIHMSGVITTVPFQSWQTSLFKRKMRLLPRIYRLVKKNHEICEYFNFTVSQMSSYRHFTHLIHPSFWKTHRKRKKKKRFCIGITSMYINL